MQSNLIFFGVAALLLAGTASHFADRFEAPASKAAAPKSVAVAAAPAAAPRQASGTQSVTVRKDRRGHYQVDAAVNGRRMDLMVDTGASVVALTRQDAQRLGLNPSPSDYTARISTANGVVRAAPARLEAIEIGNIVVRDVAAMVMPDGVLAENLLGLSFLSRLRRYEFSDGRLVLEN